MWMTKYAFVCLLLFLAGCRQDMGQQPKYRPLEASTFFADGRSERQPVPGSVARNLTGDEAAPIAFKTGNTYVAAFPYPVTLELLTRGQQRFNIYCAPCHSQTGDGNGMIVRRGFIPPPSLHAAEVRSQPVGFYFDVITNGYGAMAGYAAQVNAADRWAIVAYIRALQLSQHATIDSVPAEEKSRLTDGVKPR
jgi:mono/diheme cytochrome c family protein